jgi:hypothetical protein
MTVLQVQSLPVLANQHRQISFSCFFGHLFRQARHRKTFRFVPVSHGSLTRLPPCRHSGDPRISYIEEGLPLTSRIRHDTERRRGESMMQLPCDVG